MILAASILESFLYIAGAYVCIVLLVGWFLYRSAARNRKPPQ